MESWTAADDVRDQRGCSGNGGERGQQSGAGEKSTHQPHVACLTFGTISSEVKCHDCFFCFFGGGLLSLLSQFRAPPLCHPLQ